jgi:hypothetical protein
MPGNESHTLPIIVYDEMKGKIKIKGRSISNEAEQYWGEFLTYLKDCTSKRPTDMDITIELDYFGTKTAKILMTFFGIIKDEIVTHGFKANIDWVAEEGDDDNLDIANDYQSLTDLTFNIITKPE